MTRKNSRRLPGLDLSKAREGWGALTYNLAFVEQDAPSGVILVPG